jgi:hypothetical protein
VAPIQPPTLNKAWEFHKDADSLLHSRISSFVLAQSFLILGYIGSISSVLQHHHPTIVRLASGGATIGGLSFLENRPAARHSAWPRAVKMSRKFQRFFEPPAKRRSRLIPKPWPGRFDHRGPQARAFPGTR